MSRVNNYDTVTLLWHYDTVIIVALQNAEDSYDYYLYPLRAFLHIFMLSVSFLSSLEETSAKLCLIKLNPALDSILRFLLPTVVIEFSVWSFALSLSLSLSHPLYLCFYPLQCLSLSHSVFSLYLSRFVSLYLNLSIFISLCFSLSLTPLHCFISLSHSCFDYLTLILSLILLFWFSLSLSISLLHCFFFSLSLAFYLSHSLIARTFKCQLWSPFKLYSS